MIGPEQGLTEICAINDGDRLSNYPFYFAAIGELELRKGQRESARVRFLEARSVARNPMEARFLDQRILECERRGEARRAYYERFWSRALNSLKTDFETGAESETEGGQGSVGTGVLLSSGMIAFVLIDFSWPRVAVVTIDRSRSEKPPSKSAW